MATKKKVVFKKYEFSLGKAKIVVMASSAINAKRGMKFKNYPPSVIKTCKLIK